MYRSISFALRVNMYAMNHNCSSHPRALAVISRTSPSKQPYGAAHRKALARAVHVSAAYNGVESDNLIQPGLAYSAEWNEAYWRTRPVTVQKRLITIGWAVTKWQVWKRVNGSTPDAPYLLKILAELGPAFVKIGQAVSTRADVVPPEYLRELEKLQDDIPAYDTAEAFTVIQTDLGRPVSELFSVITPEPVAAASLGQVYKATLKATGEVVAVKVQRPGVMETIALDIFILRNLAWWLRRLGKLNSDLPGLIDEWAASIYREMSYIEERNNAVEFKEMFAHYTEIYVPRMYDEYSSERVLTMEWVDGQKPRSGSDNQVGTSSPDDIRLVEVGVRCSLEQMLQGSCSDGYDNTSVSDVRDNFKSRSRRGVDQYQTL